MTEGGQTSTSELLTFEGNALMCINNKSTIIMIYMQWQGLD